MQDEYVIKKSTELFVHAISRPSRLKPRKEFDSCNMAEESRNQRIEEHMARVEREEPEHERLQHAKNNFPNNKCRGNKGETKIFIARLLLAGPTHFSDIMRITGLSRCTTQKHLFNALWFKRIRRGWYELTEAGHQAAVASIGEKSLAIKKIG